jgi:aldehyde:ferredoxin oxidoreductase
VAELRAQPATAQRFPKYGTAAVMEVVNKLGGLPIRGFRIGHDERVQATSGLLGANLDIWDFDQIAEFGVGGAMIVAMEAGLIPWGSASGMLAAFDAIRSGSPLGRILGMGAGLAGKALGVTRVPVVKNQTISAYDPRVIKGNGVTYCTSPMGADHTAGNTIGARTDHLDPADKVALSREAQIASTLLDAFGFCNFARGVYGARPETHAALYEARLGQAISTAEMRRYAARVNRWELEFHVRAGGPALERLPEWMQHEALPPHDAAFDVSPEAMLKLWDEI